MRLPYQTLQAALDVAEVKAIATGTVWYVNRLASSGPMRYEVSTHKMDTTFGGGTLVIVLPPVAQRPQEPVQAPAAPEEPIGPQEAAQAPQEAK
jgi:hypothetical protein